MTVDAFGKELRVGDRIGMAIDCFLHEDEGEITEIRESHQWPVVVKFLIFGRFVSLQFESEMLKKVSV